MVDEEVKKRVFEADPKSSGVRASFFLVVIL